MTKRVKVVEKHEDGTETPMALTETLADGSVVPMEDYPVCERCGKPFAEPREGKLCYVCLKKALQVPPDDVGALPIPGCEHEPSAKKEGRSSLDVAIERHKNLTPAIEKFTQRLGAWVNLGERLYAAQIAGVVVKTTLRSRRRSWLKPGLQVALRPDIAKEYGALYTAEELAHLEVVAVLESKVLLTTGTRELGLVPLAHIRRS